MPDHQFGFRKEHSTFHQLVLFTENIKQMNSADIGAILLDIEKAFDKMWHRGLIYIMELMKFPIKLTRLIQSYLANSKFRVN
ncbi:reverse transcriptase domain-containing protein, partial [Klebsiella pneumoniae]|uniref:reverse transcriptase domain-containing protein n=1 Tax=Klebsiella pneumoniae TaxID=573 RepID=UPI0034DF903F